MEITDAVRRRAVTAVEAVRSDVSAERVVAIIEQILTGNTPEEMAAAEAIEDWCHSHASRTVITDMLAQYCIEMGRVAAAAVIQTQQDSGHPVPAATAPVAPQWNVGDKVEWERADSVLYGVVTAPPPNQAPGVIAPEIVPVIMESEGAESTLYYIRREALRRDSRPRSAQAWHEFVLSTLTGNEQAFEHLAERRNQQVAHRQARLCQEARKIIRRKIFGETLCTKYGCFLPAATRIGRCKQHDVP